MWSSDQPIPVLLLHLHVVGHQAFGVVTEALRDLVPDLANFVDDGVSLRLHGLLQVTLASYHKCDFL